MNPQPKFLTLDQVVALHKIQIDQFGGSHGVKDEGLLLSALGQPESGFGDQYFHKDLYEMAAAYLFHLVKNHAFHDGNKRIAALTAAVFLEVNGLTVTADEDEFEKLVLDAAQSLANKEQIADFFRLNTSPISAAP
ncbi:MAG: type II toxin-antitoxin system death-on-curing family toxin [Bdellovibrio sp.]|nr:MAG: type II toxin-antitoxin system death-on-curing family toxin [Bdellovibrio sp.]